MGGYPWGGRNYAPPITLLLGGERGSARIRALVIHVYMSYMYTSQHPLIAERIMAENQVVLTIRVPENLSERLQQLASQLNLVRRSRSDAARQALERGIEQMELELAATTEAPAGLNAQVADLQHRLLELERKLNGAPVTP